jgi:hypothetical protein
MQASSGFSMEGPFIQSFGQFLWRGLCYATPTNARIHRRLSKEFSKGQARLQTNVPQAKDTWSNTRTDSCLVYSVKKQ